MKRHLAFHDGFFDGLLIESNTVSVFLRTHENQTFLATAGNVSALCLNDVWEGNIIYDVEVFDFDEISHKDVSEARRDPDPTRAEKALFRGREEGLLLIRINPSYGASLVMIAGSFEVAARS